MRIQVELLKVKHFTSGGEAWNFGPMCCMAKLNSADRFCYAACKVRRAVSAENLSAPAATHKLWFVISCRFYRRLPAMLAMMTTSPSTVTSRSVQIGGIAVV